MEYFAGLDVSVKDTSVCMAGPTAARSASRLSTTGKTRALSVGWRSVTGPHRVVRWEC